MTQYEAFKILQDLGGKATVKQIIEHTKTAAPRLYQTKHIYYLLRQLQRWDYLDFNYNTKTYTIKKEFPKPELIRVTVDYLIW
jgi:hypothetical protein